MKNKNWEAAFLAEAAMCENLEARRTPALALGAGSLFDVGTSTLTLVLTDDVDPAADVVFNTADFDTLAEIQALPAEDGSPNPLSGMSLAQLNSVKNLVITVADGHRMDEYSGNGDLDVLDAGDFNSLESVMINGAEKDDLIEIDSTNAGLSLTINGNGGNDELDTDADSILSNTINGGDGDDTILGSNGNDTLDGGDGDDDIHGGNGDDVILVGIGDDSIEAGTDADETLIGEVGNDLVIGDVAILDNTSTDPTIKIVDASTGPMNLLELINSGVVRLNAAGPNTILDLSGTEFDIVMSNGNLSAGFVWLGSVGDGTAVEIRGFHGFIGGQGNDYIIGTDADDTMIGNGGNDTLIGGGGNDFIDGKGDNDLLSGGDGEDELRGGFGADTLYGGDGADLLTGDTGSDVAFGGAGDDSLYGGYGNDLLRGGSGNDEIFAGDGNDYLAGGADNDILRGGRGIDVAAGRADEVAEGIEVLI